MNKMKRGLLLLNLSYMKSKLFKFAILIFVSSVFSTSCSNNNDDNPTINNTQTNIERNAKSGTWRITRYIDSGNDEVNHFTGYNFTFGANNVLTAKNVTNTYIGTWSITDSNSNDDSLEDLDFNIFFASPPDFQELSDNWHFVSQTSTKIELIDISGGNGGIDYLTFEKN
jgi:hypothetical protein